MTQKLNLLLDQLETYIPQSEKTNPKVSAATVGWQIDHCFLVINNVVAAVKFSDPAQYKWKFNKNRFLIHTILRKIPRGKVRAPKAVRPSEGITKEHLKDTLEFTRKQVSELEHLQARNYFTHPFMGDLDLKTTIDFLGLHTRHHLKIIEDILNK